MVNIKVICNCLCLHIHECKQFTSIYLSSINQPDKNDSKQTHFSLSKHDKMTLIVMSKDFEQMKKAQDLKNNSIKDCVFILYLLK